MTAFLILLQILDLLTTTWLLRRPGYRESNPIMAKLIGELDALPALILAKGVAVFAVLYFSPLPVWVLLVACLVYLIVVVNNMRLVLSHG